MGRSQILADITDFKLDPKAAHNVGKTRLVDSTVPTRGVWEQDEAVVAESVAAEDLAYLQERLKESLAIPEEFLVQPVEIVTVDVTPEPIPDVVEEVKETPLAEVVTLPEKVTLPDDVGDVPVEGVVTETQQEKKPKTLKKKKVDKET